MSAVGRPPVTESCTWSCGPGPWAENTRGLSPRPAAADAEEEQRSQPRCRSGSPATGHRIKRPRGQVGPPGPHPAYPSSSLNPGGERWPTPPPLAPLIAQLVRPFNGVKFGSLVFVFLRRGAAPGACAGAGAGVRLLVWFVVGTAYSPCTYSLRPPVLIVKNRRYAPAGRLLRGVWPSTMYNDHAL
jgi:hypothetical protein